MVVFVAVNELTTGMALGLDASTGVPTTATITTATGAAIVITNLDRIREPNIRWAPRFNL